MILPPELLREALVNVAHIYCFRDYELLDDFRPRPGWTVVDIGGYLGIWTLRAARAVSQGGEVVYVEANPELVSFASRSFEVNGFKNVRIVPRAIAPEKGAIKIYVPERRINSSVLRGYSEIWGGVEREIEVRAITLETLLELIGKPVDLIKMDIEGLEQDVLSSSREELRKKTVRRLVVEVHSPFSDPLDIAELLRNCGYRCIVYDVGLPSQSFVYAFT